MADNSSETILKAVLNRMLKNETEAVDVAEQPEEDSVVKSLQDAIQQSLIWSSANLDQSVLGMASGLSLATSTLSNQGLLVDKSQTEDDLEVLAYLTDGVLYAYSPVSKSDTDEEPNEFGDLLIASEAVLSKSSPTDNGYDELADQVNFWRGYALGMDVPNVPGCGEIEKAWSDKARQAAVAARHGAGKVAGAMLAGPKKGAALVGQGAKAYAGSVKRGVSQGAQAYVAGAKDVPGAAKKGAALVAGYPSAAKKGIGQGAALVAGYPGAAKKGIGQGAALVKRGAQAYTDVAKKVGNAELDLAKQGVQAAIGGPAKGAGLVKRGAKAYATGVKQGVGKGAELARRGAKAYVASAKQVAGTPAKAAAALRQLASKSAVEDPGLSDYLLEGVAFAYAPISKSDPSAEGNEFGQLLVDSEVLLVKSNVEDEGYPELVEQVAYWRGFAEGAGIENVPDLEEKGWGAKAREASARARAAKAAGHGALNGVSPAADTAIRTAKGALLGGVLVGSPLGAVVGGAYGAQTSPHFGQQVRDVGGLISSKVSGAVDWARKNPGQAILAAGTAAGALGSAALAAHYGAPAVTAGAKEFELRREGQGLGMKPSLRMAGQEATGTIQQLAANDVQKVQRLSKEVAETAGNLPAKVGTALGKTPLGSKVQSKIEAYQAKKKARKETLADAAEQQARFSLGGERQEWSLVSELSPMLKSTTLDEHVLDAVVAIYKAEAAVGGDATPATGATAAQAASGTADFKGEYPQPFTEGESGKAKKKSEKKKKGKKESITEDLEKPEKKDEEEKSSADKVIQVLDEKKIDEKFNKKREKEERARLI